MLEAGEMMELESVDEEDGIYRLLNHNSSHDIYVSASRMECITTIRRLKGRSGT